jgi:hypothetical protein
MIAALLAASISVPTAALPPRHHRSALPCQAVPSLCLMSDNAVTTPIHDRTSPGRDTKMSAYGFDARPCRVIGNMGCPKKARLRLFRLGEPLRETLLRSFAPR